MIVDPTLMQVVRYATALKVMDVELKQRTFKENKAATTYENANRSCDDWHLELDELSDHDSEEGDNVECPYKSNDLSTKQSYLDQTIRYRALLRIDGPVTNDEYCNKKVKHDLLTTHLAALLVATSQDTGDLMKKC